MCQRRLWLVKAAVEIATRSVASINDDSTHSGHFVDAIGYVTHYDDGSSSNAGNERQSKMTIVGRRGSRRLAVVDVGGYAYQLLLPE